MMFESRGDFAHPEIRHASTGLEVAGETERFLPPHRPMELSESVSLAAVTLVRRWSVRRRHRAHRAGSEKSIAALTCPVQ
jgi:hypothetical protein